MNLKLFDRASKYIEKMLISRRDDWCVKRLYIKPNCYLQIEVMRIDLDNSDEWPMWERGAPYDLQLYITDKAGIEIDGCTVQYPFSQHYKKDLVYLLGMFT